MRSCAADAFLVPVLAAPAASSSFFCCLSEKSLIMMWRRRRGLRTRAAGSEGDTEPPLGLGAERGAAWERGSGQRATGRGLPEGRVTQKRSLTPKGNMDVTRGEMGTIQEEMGDLPGAGLAIDLGMSGTFDHG
ncbi:hypothetical protein chiPu_0026884 [Chiloscyllium punctatum]|uniref:Uncharacterized protein n=1 Tax=Chiloscyllium punctatum TaxID=137246 RepID=A0A401TJ72_CHIPU|nr:hypothetical protein [Chiloscyllium punctatum]